MRSFQKLKFKFLPILALGFLSVSIYAQELNCNIIINSEQVQTTEKRVFEDMEIAFAQFLNDRKWTSDVFENKERINCNLLMTIRSQPSIGQFVADVQIQSARPIYETNYESIILNFADRNWQFRYTESQPLEFNENNALNSNLTSMLAYYAYIIIGLEYDTFGKLDGTPYLEKAWNIVTAQQQTNSPGWEQLGSNRNRYWLAENMLNPQMIQIREGLYDYHRLGMDAFNQNPDESRIRILNALKKLQEVNKVKPNSILTIAFFDAKSAELINIFSRGEISIRRQAYEVMKELDPSNTDKYNKILEN